MNPGHIPHGQVDLHKYICKLMVLLSALLSALETCILMMYLVLKSSANLNNWHCYPNGTAISTPKDLEVKT